MVRRYEEPIEVRQSVLAGHPLARDVAGAEDGARSGDVTSGGDGAAPLAGPEAFVWRGRLYVVRAVLDRWQERRPWWRDAREQGSGDVLTDARERQVWRVEASAGRCAGVGVYDLGADPQGLGTPHWRLLRVAD
ncbi:hypothetical protein GCM10025782_10640 [Pedococcus ginsenosidimutans]|uniref:DUF6504 domain-containing protein n=1 Tax=Pedococcus ginsenosidimutans TaxID=490570 RepID=A0ABP8XXY7_9MICO